MRTIKESCLDRIMLVGEVSLRRAVREFADHYHHERNHQGLGNQLIVPLGKQPNREGHIACRERLGGLLKYYHRLPRKSGRRRSQSRWLRSRSPRGSTMTQVRFGRHRHKLRQTFPLIDS